MQSFGGLAKLFFACHQPRSADNAINEIEIGADCNNVKEGAFVPPSRIEEDRDMVNSLQHAMTIKGYEPGRLAGLEGPLHHVVNGILDRLFDDDEST